MKQREWVGSAITIPGVGRFVIGGTPEESRRAVAMKRALMASHPDHYDVEDLLLDHPELNDPAVWTATRTAIAWWTRAPDGQAE